MSNSSIRKRIIKLEDMIIVKPKEEVILVWSWGPESEPHGKYGYRKYHMRTGEIEACTEVEEIELLRQAYYRIPPKIRKKVEYWSSFEKFKEQHVCYFEERHNAAENMKEFGKINEEILSVGIENFLRELKMDIRNEIREGEIEDSESVRKILEIFPD